MTARVMAQLSEQQDTVPHLCWLVPNDRHSLVDRSGVTVVPMVVESAEKHDQILNLVTVILCQFDVMLIVKSLLVILTVCCSD